MSCHAVRKTLLQSPVRDLSAVQAHLETCEDCRALADALIAGDAAVDAWVDGFEASGAFERAWRRAERDTAPRQVPLGLLLAATAMLAALVVGVGVTLVAMPPGQVDRAEAPAVVAVQPVPDAVADAVDTGDVRPRPSPDAPAPAPRFDRDPAPYPLSPPVRSTPRAGWEPVPAPSPSPEPMAMAATPTDTSGCEELVLLEPTVMMGRLSDEQRSCLEERYAVAAIVEREKVSWVLMANAWSKGDHRDWERLVARHLSEVSSDDPDLSYKFALYLSVKGSDRAEEVIQWSEVALAHQQRWTDLTFGTRVYNAHKLRARAASELWEAAVREGASAEEIAARRDRAQVTAQDWLDAALLLAKDPTTAAALCEAAKGSPCP